MNTAFIFAHTVQFNTIYHVYFCLLIFANIQRVKKKRYPYAKDKAVNLRWQPRSSCDGKSVENLGELCIDSF